MPEVVLAKKFKVALCQDRIKHIKLVLWINCKIDVYLTYVVAYEYYVILGVCVLNYTIWLVWNETTLQHFFISNKWATTELED